MKKSLIALALLASFGVANAQSSGSVENGGAVAGANSSSGSLSASGSESTSVSKSGAQSGSAAGAESGSAAKSEINLTIEASQPIPETRAVNRVINEGTTRVKTAPPVTVTGPASGPCTGFSGGAGASWLGGGFGFNAATVDRNCSLRENARIFAMIIPTLPPDEQAQVRAMLMGTLNSIYDEHVLREPKPQPK